mmetsp:Transcript_11711/g.25723  ORF Transcript_11711/g.25723 Transcript_11711/m.25723 type:complete len:105 (+) Transcript_11711:801-1115(+)
MLCILGSGKALVVRILSSELYFIIFILDRYTFTTLIFIVGLENKVTFYYLLILRKYPRHKVSVHHNSIVQIKLLTGYTTDHSFSSLKTREMGTQIHMSYSSYAS